MPIQFWLWSSRDILCVCCWRFVVRVCRCMCVWVCVSLCVCVLMHEFVSKIELDWPSERAAADLIAFACLPVRLLLLHIACCMWHTAGLNSEIFVACNLINCSAMHKLWQNYSIAQRIKAVASYAIGIGLAKNWITYIYAGYIGYKRFKFS